MHKNKDKNLCYNHIYQYIQAHDFVVVCHFILSCPVINYSIVQNKMIDSFVLFFTGSFSIEWGKFGAVVFSYLKEGVHEKVKGYCVIVS